MSIYPSGVGMSSNGAPRWRLYGVQLQVCVVKVVGVPGGSVRHTQQLTLFVRGCRAGGSFLVAVFPV